MRKPRSAQRTVSNGTKSATSATSSSSTSSNQAVPVAVPFQPRCRRTRSWARVATNSVSTVVQSRVAPTAGEWLVKGKEAIDRQAGTAVG